MTLAVRERVKRLLPGSLLIRDLGEVAVPTLLLTFDDGPDPAVTPGVLDRLDAHGARALFFVVGRRAEASPDVLQEIHRRGHRIGNHTYQHRNTGDPAFTGYLRDVRRCQDVVARGVGTAPVFFRPPRGHLSLTSLSVPRLLGLRTVNWSVNVRDWACRTSEEALTAARELDGRASPGSIVLLHDDNRFVLEILDYILPRWVARGLDLRTGLELLEARRPAA